MVVIFALVQMQKDGAYRVVYGTQLKDIIGKVKMVAVGYGREAEDGSQTLGGRSAWFFGILLLVC
jgi:hypothetical protein